MTEPVGPSVPDGPTALAWMTDAAERLDRAGYPGRIETRRLLDEVAGLSPARLLAHPETRLTRDRATALDSLVAARLRGAPLQYLTRTTSFRHLELTVGPGVFVPRPETEGLVERVIEALRGRPPKAPPPLILEFGPGSGAILASLLFELPNSRGVAIEISPAALDYARANMAAAGVLDRATLLSGDLDEPLAGPEWIAAFDAVVSNPPYIPDGAWQTLPVDVRDFEPRVALLGGPDGTDVIARIAAAAPRLLRSGGLLALEIDESHAPRVLDLLAATGSFHDARIEPDLAGRPRYALARRISDES